jgi:hypothetical protein
MTIGAERAQLIMKKAELEAERRRKVASGEALAGKLRADLSTTVTPFAELDLPGIVSGAEELNSIFIAVLEIDGTLKKIERELA